VVSDDTHARLPVRAVCFTGLIDDHWPHGIHDPRHGVNIVVVCLALRTH